MKNKKFCGFTLSEILVTMLVLGTLFLIYLPTLMNSHEKNTIQAGLIDAFKEFNKVIFNYTSSEAKRCKGNLTCTNTFSSDGQPAHEFSSEFQGVPFVGKDCWGGITIASDIDKRGSEIDLSGYECFIDGKNRIWAFYNFKTDCATNLYNNAASRKNHKLEKSCGYLIVDLNGKKTPNTFGRDVFVYIITDAVSAYLYPVGGSLAQNSFGGVGVWQGTCGDDDGSKEGRTCAGRIMEDGWKVRYIK